MNVPEFKGLSKEEISMLLEAPARIAVLIAGADHNLDEKETGWASQLVNYRSFSSDFELRNYYEGVYEGYGDFPGFDHFLNQLEDEWDADKTQGQLEQELADLKPILAKLNSKFADQLVKSWRSLAKKVAQSSGGILGLGSTTKSERDLMHLHMLE